MNEIWKDIPDYEGHYQISNFGRVKSLKFNKNKIIIPRKTKNGYFDINLCKNNYIKNYKIHRLLMLTFKSDNYFDEAIINHIDGNKLNNNLDNLEWCTYQENSKHSYKIGLQTPTKGESHGMSKLNEKQVRIIRLCYINKYFNQYELGKIFNINQPNISNIINNKTW